jgi:hypothetical protein
MKKISLLALGIALAATCFAQPAELSKKMGFGFQLGQYQNDFGVGAQVTSPFFFYKRLAVRARANVMWNDHVQDGMATWSSYSNLSVGVVGLSGEIANIIRLYGEGGLLILLPNEAFSSSASEVGGYGLFGFEFFLGYNFNYYIEIGGAGTGAVADKIATQPIYSNGLLIQTGFRFQL